MSTRHSPAWLTIGATDTTDRGHPLVGTASPDSAQRLNISRPDSLLRKLIPSPQARLGVVSKVENVHS